ncbi:MAG: S1C family serine protease [Clostridia bacterium]|nr:S1C family serine protease [Clostridia bacterium]
MHKILKKFVVLLVALSIMTSGFSSFAAGSDKSISVSVNSVSVKINGKAAKIDNFSYSGKIYLQAQDISSLLGIGYTYDLKSKTVNINSKKPAKAVSLSKAKFASIKTSSTKTLKVTANPAVIKIDGKAAKLENYIYENAVFVSAKDAAVLLNKDFSLDTKKKLLAINEKKPSTPTFAPDTLEKTKGNVTVSIMDWGNAQIKEYKIGNGVWQKYTTPVVMKENGTLYARGTNAAGIASDVASIEIDNMLRLLTKVQVAELKKSVVKVMTYNKNKKELGTGSGFYISDDGNVVTNYHVIDLASYIEVEDVNGKKYNVSGVLGYSVDKDLAILKLENVVSVPSLELGNSDSLVYGEDVVAIGYPLGMPVNVTFGNIGSLSIDGLLSREKKYKDIQISTPISSGNSGGPLLNMYGEVIGINYAVIDGSDAVRNAQSLNRTIPVTDLKPMLSSMNEQKLSEVIDEVYSKKNYDDIAKRVYYDYYDYTQGDYDLDLNGVVIFEDDENKNQLNVMLIQSPESFEVVKEAEAKGSKHEVENWIKTITEEIQKQYPDKYVEVYLYYVEYSKAQPTALETYEYFFDQERGEWRIYRFKVLYYKEYGEYKFYWS